MDLTSRIAPPEIEVVSTYRVSCDGGEGGLGHPRIWMPVPQDIGWVDCSYCDKRFLHADYVEKHEAFMAGADIGGPDKAA